jgi:hypothetical protein
MPGVTLPKKSRKYATIQLKRTALDKAKMHGNMEAVRMLEEYVRENSRYLV